ncbi:MAG: hypothetical protein J3K34DRAFT_438300 [Monoraphidium minutum]|nr:MAG: hypothetical protein J3K34DRAFT_438300 [Monoraphidium minutum]
MGWGCKAGMAIEELISVQGPLCALSFQGRGPPGVQRSTRAPTGPRASCLGGVPWVCHRTQCVLTVVMCGACRQVSGVNDWSGGQWGTVAVMRAGTSPLLGRHGTRRGGLARVYVNWGQGTWGGCLGSAGPGAAKACFAAGRLLPPPPHPRLHHSSSAASSAAATAPSASGAALPAAALAATGMTGAPLAGACGSPLVLTAAALMVRLAASTGRSAARGASGAAVRPRKLQGSGTDSTRKMAPSQA